MANTRTGTPLTRHGSRVPTIAPRTVTATPAATPRAVVTPTATIRSTMICLPDALPTQVLTSTRSLDRHLGVAATGWARLWAVGALRWWQHRQMIDLRKGRPAYCAGGPVRLLDLAGMRHGAGVGAGIRHQLWTSVVHGTPRATPWHVFEARHLADPSRYPLDTAKADFNAQPRVNAMRMHNAAAYGAAQLDPMELEMLQAGQVAYQHYHALWAICTDAVITDRGHRLQPDSDAFAHRVTYLEQAIRHIDTLDAPQRLLAIRL